MPTLYEFICQPCFDVGVVLEEHLEPGRVTVFSKPEDRDTIEVVCPNCFEPMQRSAFPDRVTVRWVSNKSSHRYPIMEGPSDNVYLRGEERKKKAAREASRKHFNLMTPAQDKELKADAQRAPRAQEVPSPGVSVQKVP